MKVFSRSKRKEAILAIFIIIASLTLGLYIYENSLDIFEPIFIGIQIRSPPSLRNAYYYGCAESYVPKEYQVPDNKGMEGLIFFLNQIELPKYVEDEFDCSECSSLVEWLLEGAGFHTYIAQTVPQSDYVVPHTWIQVETEDGLVAIEATELTNGWSDCGSIKSWGIVSKPDGAYMELTYQYRCEYQLFLDWKEKFSSAEYVWDRSIPFEEWRREYTGPSVEIIVIGIPTNSEYYSQKNRREFPTSECNIYDGFPWILIKFVLNGWAFNKEYDWWHNAPFNLIYPFTYW